jgi:exosortase/archaeosortase family protein
VATAQALAAWRFGRPDQAVTVMVAWGAAVTLASQIHRDEGASPPPRSGRDDHARPGLWAWRALGVLGALGAFGIALRAHAYHPTFRVMPAVSGAFIALGAGGPRGLRRDGRAIALLALPMANPLPKVLRGALAPTTWTAWSAMAIDRALGHDVTVSGTVLHMPGATLEVLSECGGILSVSELFVLAILTITFFPTTVRQKIALFASAAVLGFAVNSFRIAVLANELVHGDVQGYEYWHIGGGSGLFSLGATAMAGAAWWWLLRARGAESASSWAPFFLRPPGWITPQRRPSGSSAPPRST